MTKRILAFGASTSRASINKQFAGYAASLLPEFESTIIDLNDYPMPLFSVDVQAEQGAPATAFSLKELIVSHDGIIVSLAEHNGAYTAAFKNAYDWLSRLDGKLWASKPLLLLSTSPGSRGAATVLSIAKSRFPFDGGEVVGSFSLPQFKINFHHAEGIKDVGLRRDFEEVLNVFRARLNK